MDANYLTCFLTYFPYKVTKMAYHPFRSSSRFGGAFILLLLIAALAIPTDGCMSPSPTNPVICPFGIPEAKLARKSAAANAVHVLRGGEVHEPETLEDVNSLVLRAGSAGQLVVIDFTAT